MINYTNEESYNNYCILVDVNKKISLTNKQKNNFMCDFNQIIDSENKLVFENNNLYYMTKIASLSCNSLNNFDNSSNSSNSFEESEDKTTNETLSPNATNSFEESEFNTTESDEYVNSPNKSNLTSQASSQTSSQTSSPSSTKTNVSITLFKVPDKAKRNFIQIPYNVQTSHGERIFLVSENNMFSLRANINGDLFILTMHGQVCWLRNSRNYNFKINGPPILELSNYGELIMSIDGQILYVSDKLSVSNNYKLELTNSCELLVERSQTVIINTDYYRRTTIIKKIQSIIFRQKKY